MDLKRKHVVFAEDNGSSSPALGDAGSSAAGPSVHPDRAAVAHHPLPKKAKTKSANKKRYDAKKQRKQRKMKAARKAAAPKPLNLKAGLDGGDESDSDSGSEEETETRKAPEVTTTQKEESEEERDDVPPPPSKGATGNKEIDEREKRKAEKRAKRDERRQERKERRKAEREAAAAKAKAEAERAARRAAAAQAGEGGSGDTEEVDERVLSSPTLDEAPEGSGGDSDAEAESESETERHDVPDLPHRLSSPPPLEPFPLPRLAPAPDAAVLSRQGMPTGLQDAEFVDQDTRLPLDGLDEKEKGVSLSERMRKRLSEIGVEDFFAVQAAILPHLLKLPLVPLPHAQLSDFLISAPTGSGKTLAYAVPIVELLSKRIVTRLRALIVLPTRDLVVQVRETLEALAKGTGLMIGSVTGQHSFAHEQTQLVGEGPAQLGGHSKLDILIATPGRLMDHLATTPNFTLQHLRFLVIDEADRLLTQSFQNWLAQVLAHTRPPTSPPSISRGPADAVASAWAVSLGAAPSGFEGSEPAPSTCQKLLFSATLTRDPAKVAALDLSSPRYFIVQSPSHPLSAAAIGSAFALPSELSERMLILPPALKPLNLIHLLHSDFNASPALVFTKSVEAATRLVKLLEFFEDAYIGGKRLTVRVYTRDMAPAERKRLRADFADGKVDVIVCSDLVARGIDLPSVEHVISYDVPLDMTKYVHRAGRTARAGRAGTAWTLVEKQEATHFKGMLKAADHEVRKVKVKEDDLAGYRESYEMAMRRLKEVYGRE